MTEFLIAFVSVVAATASPALWLGRHRRRMVTDSVRRSPSFMALLITHLPILYVQIFTFTLLNIAGFVAFGRSSNPVWLDAVHITAMAVVVAMIIPRARFNLVDVPMADSWWVSTWHRRVVCWVFVATGAATLVAFVLEDFPARYLMLGLWFFVAAWVWWWNGGRGDGWGDAPVDIPDPAGSATR